MTSNVITKYYRPHLWVYGVSGLFLVMAAVLWSMPKIDAWVMAKRTPTTPAQATAQVDPAIAMLEKEAESYEVWITKEPDNEKALRGLLDARLKLNDIAGAAIALEGLARIHGDNPDYLILLGQVKQEAKDYEGSAAAYKKILITDPTNIKALQGMVDLLLVQNRPEGAIGLLQTTIKDMGKLKPDQTIKIDQEKLTSVQLMLGQVYVEQKRFTEAIAIYDQAAAINKTDFRPVLAKAMVLKQQGKDAAAKPFFTMAISLAPAQYKDQIKDMAVFDATELKALEAAGKLQTKTQPNPAQPQVTPEQTMPATTNVQPPVTPQP